MRDSLAELDFGRLSKRLREIVPLRQDDLAGITGLTQGYLSRLEAGRVQLTHIERIVDFLDAVGAPPALVKLPLRGAASTAPLESASSSPTHDDVAAPWTARRMVAALHDAMRGEPAAMRPNRRHFLILAGTALSAYIHQWAIADAEPLGRALDGAQVVPGLVASFQGTIDGLRTMDASSGSGLVAGLARAHLSLIYETLKSARYDEKTGRRLAGIAADTATQLGWFHFDTGHHEAAQRALLAALRAAHASGDPRYGVGALSYLAIQSYSVGNPRDAVTAMQSAREKVRTLGSSYLEAMLLTRQARGHAKLGEEQACLRALGRAAELAEQGPGEQDPGWLYWMNRGEILGQTASCYLQLGEHTTAAGYFEQAASTLNPADLRTRALFASRAASAHLLAGERDGGFMAADTALTLATSVQSARLNEHLEQVVENLQAIPGPRSGELIERSRQVMAAKEFTP
ncbi:helix-turn-helix domain-containing protein [Kitasatospora aureofaciens]|uniref:helix-turn-helix domain-containing protein n=1 Tax=Kitasatospora aureofaciens TaxID=1894 RepID=UPI0027E1C261|nr:helix-turn-helix transcriptional regulator [Kitasatospora aureofaciens]